MFIVYYVVGDGSVTFLLFHDDQVANALHCCGLPSDCVFMIP